MAWAKAGKIGLVSSGVTRPTRPALRCRSRTGLSYPSTSSAASTALTGAARHARLAVQDPADGRLADRGLSGDVREPRGGDAGPDGAAPRRRNRHTAHHTVVSAGSFASPSVDGDLAAGEQHPAGARVSAPPRRSC